MKKNNDKTVSLRMDIKENNEVFKRKEKEIYNLETKVAYQEHTTATRKKTYKNNKNEVKKLNKSLRRTEKAEKNNNSKQSLPLIATFVERSLVL